MYDRDDFEEKLRKAITEETVIAGEHVPGVGEDIKPKRTLGERFATWFMDASLYDAERELILQEARRLKLKTDLQEERIARRKLRAEEARDPTIPVGYWVHSGAYVGDERTEENQRVTVTTLYRNKEDTYRRARLTSVTNGKGSVAATGDSWAYLRTKRCWNTCIVPWLNGVYTTEQLRGKWDQADKKNRLTIY